MYCQSSKHKQESQPPNIYIAPPYSTHFHKWDEVVRKPFMQERASGQQISVLCPLCYVRDIGLIRLTKKTKGVQFGATRTLEVWLRKDLAKLRPVGSDFHDLHFWSWQYWPSDWYRNSQREIAELIFDEIKRLARLQPDLVPLKMIGGKQELLPRSLYTFVALLP